MDEIKISLEMAEAMIKDLNITNEKEIELIKGYFSLSPLDREKFTEFIKGLKKDK